MRAARQLVRKLCAELVVKARLAHRGAIETPFDAVVAFRTRCSETGGYVCRVHASNRWIYNGIRATVDWINDVHRMLAHINLLSFESVIAHECGNAAFTLDCR